MVCRRCRHRHRRRRFRRGRGLQSYELFGRLLLVWFGWRCRGRGSHWLFESAAHKVAFHGVSFQADLCRGEPSRAVREIVVVSVNFGWFYVQIVVVFTFLGWFPLPAIPFLNLFLIFFPSVWSSSSSVVVLSGFLLHILCHRPRS